MKMNRNEMEALYAFGCPNLKATVERLRMVAVERWYRCFYCKLRVLKNHREGCYDETDED